MKIDDDNVVIDGILASTWLSDNAGSIRKAERELMLESNETIDLGPAMACVPIRISPSKVIFTKDQRRVIKRVIMRSDPNVSAASRARRPRRCPPRRRTAAAAAAAAAAS